MLRAGRLGAPSEASSAAEPQASSWTIDEVLSVAPRAAGPVPGAVLPLAAPRVALRSVTDPALGFGNYARSSSAGPTRPSCGDRSRRRRSSPSCASSLPTRSPTRCRRRGARKLQSSPCSLVAALDQRRHPLLRLDGRVPAPRRAQRGARSLGWIDEPIRFLPGTIAVNVGMVHIMLPFMILPLVATMRGIDRSLLRAAGILGAGPFTAFLKIFLPLSLPGVCAGRAGVHDVARVLHHAGAARRTATHDGGRAHRAAGQRLLDWGMASALSTLLLPLTLAIYGVYVRLTGVAGWRERAEGIEPSSARGGRPWGVVALILVFLALPTLSSSRSRSAARATCPSRRRLVDAVVRADRREPAWLQAATEFAGHRRSRPRSSRWPRHAGGARGVARRPARAPAVSILVVAPMMLPHVILAIGLYPVHAQAGAARTDVAAIIGHTIIGVPLVFITVKAALAATGIARTRGDDPRRQSMADVLDRHLPDDPASASSSAESWHSRLLRRAHAALFLTGAGTRTLPRLIWEQLNDYLTPTIAAVATLVSRSRSLLARGRARSWRGPAAARRRRRCVMRATARARARRRRKRYGESRRCTPTDLADRARRVLLAHRPERLRQDDAARDHRRLVPPSAGRIEVNGEDVAGCRPIVATSAWSSRTTRCSRT